jgi:hypothetical protein
VNVSKVQAAVTPADCHQQLGRVHKLCLVTFQVQFRHNVQGLSASSSQSIGIHAITLRGSPRQCDDPRALFATKSSAVRRPQCSEGVSEVALTPGVERQLWVSPEAVRGLLVNVKVPLTSPSRGCAALYIIIVHCPATLELTWNNACVRPGRSHVSRTADAGHRCLYSF